MSHLSNGKEFPVRTKANTGCRFDLVFGTPGSIARRICPVVSTRRREWGAREASVAQRDGCAVAALILGRRRGSAIYGCRRIDGVRSRSCAVETLGDMPLVVYARNDGGSTCCVAKGTPQRQAVEGIGGIGCGTDDLAQCETGFGTSSLDWGARGCLEEWGWRGIELDAGADGWAHHPGIGGRKRHRGLQVSGRGGLRWLADISERRHGTRRACLFGRGEKNIAWLVRESLARNYCDYGKATRQLSKTDVSERLSREHTSLGGEGRGTKGRQLEQSCIRWATCM
jgi:hypothetical protein